jgi:hypothetical protein
MSSVKGEVGIMLDPNGREGRKIFLQPAQMRDMRRVIVRNETETAEEYWVGRT